MTDSILGHSWQEIQAAQMKQGRLGRAVDLSKPAKPAATAADHELLEKHGAEGLRQMGFHGVLDRLGLPI